MNCAPEQYPAAHAPANAPPVRYEIPFTSHFNGGELTVKSPSSMVTVSFGANHSVFGDICGLFELPSESGTIAPTTPGPPGDLQFNNNLQLFGPTSMPPGLSCPASAGNTNAIPVSITLTGVDVPLICGYGAAEGSVTAQISPNPAPNGGLNLDLYGTTKATTIIDPSALVNLLAPGGALAGAGPVASLVKSLQAVAPKLSSTTGGECTLAIGDLRTTGLPAADVGPYTQPVHFTTGTSSVPPSQQFPNGVSLTGQPITGPATNAVAEPVSADFPIPPINPAMPAAATAPAPGSCDPNMANMLNGLLGYPAPPGSGTFSAPATFALATCNEPGRPACNPRPFGQ